MTAAARQQIAVAKLSKPSDREVRVERVFDASRDKVWRAVTEPKLVAQWWGRGNKLDVERMDLTPGGHWRYVEHHDGESTGFEGRYGEIVPKERIVNSFEWDGMPAHACLVTNAFEDAGNGRTRLVETSLFYTTEERDGMLESGMEGGMNESFAALDRLLATL